MIRRARVDECDALTALALRSKAVWGYSAELMRAFRDELTVSVEQLAHAFVLETHGGVVGFHAVSPIDEQRAELEFLFVEPLAIGRGHGRTLLEHARGHVRDVLRCPILVIQGDPNADRFYRAAGARHVGGRPSASIRDRVLPLYELDTLGP